MIMCAAINGTWFGPRIAKVEREVGPERAEGHAQKALREHGTSQLSLVAHVHADNGCVEN